MTTWIIIFNIETVQIGIDMLRNLLIELQQESMRSISNRLLAEDIYIIKFGNRGSLPE